MKTCALALMICAALVVATRTIAQTATGQINGTVRDASGGVIVGATVKVTDERTGVSRSTATSDAGTFAVPSLPAGVYTVRIEYAGFRAYLVKNVEVTVGAYHDLRVVLEPGTVTSNVEVTATAVQAQTTEASISSLVDSKTITQLPLNRRNPLHFLGLIPGVTGHSATATSSTGTVTHYVNGDRGRGILTTLDGIDISDPIIPRGELTNAPVNPDVVQEFRVTTALPRAEYGRNSGAQIEVVTKGGSNDFHGNLYEFLRNTSFDANGFFNNQLVNPLTGTVPIPRERLQQNQFGGSIGGPIRKNRMFFFFNYDGQRRAQSFLTTSTTYTQSAREGLFRFVRGTITSGGKSFTKLGPGLVDPSTGAVRSGVSICSPGVTTNCLDTYNVVANDPDPRALGLDPTMKRLIALYPLPNDFSSGDGLNTAFFRWNAPSQNPRNTYTAKVDYIFSPKYELSARYNLAWNDDLIGDFINDTLGRTPKTVPARSRLSRNQGAMLGLKMIWSSSLLNDVRIGFTRNTLFFADTSHPIRSGDPDFGKVPELRTSVMTTPWIYWGGTERHPEHLQIKDSVSWQRSTHMLRFGGDVRFYRFNNLRNTGSNSQGSGISTFPSVFFTQGVVTFSPRTQPFSDVADPTDQTRLRGMFNEVLGIVAQMDQAMYSDGSRYLPGRGLIMYQRQREASFYFQDDWRIRPRLTLNLGLRYELFGVPYDKGGLEVVPDRPLNQSPVTFLRAGPGTGRGWYSPDRKNLAPAVGFSWDPWGNGRTAIRGGYRISYNRLVGWALNVVEQRQPAIQLDPQIRGLCWDPTARTTSSTCGGSFLPIRLSDLSSLPGVTVVNGLPSLAPPSPNQLIFTPTAARKEAPFFFDSNFSTARIHQFSLNVQREIRPNTIVEVGYVGSRGLNLFRFVNANQPELVANQFLTDFRNAKTNLAVCRATAGCTLRFSNQGFPGQLPVPVFSALFSSTGSQTASGFSDSTNITNLDLNSIGALADRLDKRLGGSRGPLAAFGNDSFFRPSPQFDVAGVGVSNSKSWYNSFQTQVRANYHWGLQLAANYTFSKSMDDSSNETVGAGTSFDFPFNSKNIRLNRARSDYDINHIFRAYAIYELPFGRDRHFGRAWHPALNHVAGGWQFNTIVDVSSGFPFTVSSGSSTLNYFVTSPANCSAGARKSASLNKDDTRGGVWDISSQARTLFSIPDPGTLGTCGRNTFTGPGFSQFDFGIFKAFQLTESWKLDFRAELFNAFNHANFSNPSTSNLSIQSSNFGKITSTHAPNRVIQFALKLQF